MLEILIATHLKKQIRPFQPTSDKMENYDWV